MSDTLATQEYIERAFFWELLMKQDPSYLAAGYLDAVTPLRNTPLPESRHWLGTKKGLLASTALFVIACQVPHFSFAFPLNLIGLAGMLWSSTVLLFKTSERKKEDLDYADGLKQQVIFNEVNNFVVGSLGTDKNSGNRFDPCVKADIVNRIGSSPTSLWKDVAFNVYMQANGYKKQIQHDAALGRRRFEETCGDSSYYSYVNPLPTLISNARADFDEKCIGWMKEPIKPTWAKQTTEASRGRQSFSI